MSTPGKKKKGRKGKRGGKEEGKEEGEERGRKEKEGRAGKGRDGKGKLLNKIHQHVEQPKGYCSDQGLGGPCPASYADFLILSSAVGPRHPPGYSWRALGKGGDVHKQ